MLDKKVTVKMPRKEKSSTLAEKVVKKARKKVDSQTLQILVYEEGGIYKTKYTSSSGTLKSLTNTPNILGSKSFQCIVIDGAAGKYRAKKSLDENGVKFDSKLELFSHKEFEVYAEKGLISNFERQKTFSLKLKNRTYTPDFEFIANVDFTIETCKKNISFKKGCKYICDVKSLGTRRDPTWGFKKDAMEVAWGIKVIEITRKSPSIIS